MKKTKLLSVVLLLAAVISLAFSGCSDYDPNATVDQALIKDAAAVNLIKSYSTQELGLDGDWEDYGFEGYMQDPYNIKSGRYKGNYFEVRIGNKIENEDGTLNFDIAGYYLIRFDGGLILRYEPGSEEYTVIDEPDTSALTTAQ
ncbi:MAG TPA: hypothetical protein IAA48_04285 [Candidatus Eubacterium faecipullorum]|uniref:DUF4830 domain-containing protein n=1 Tax=Candidatus Eubacterium faecipullorum TaxID=2838571 RepID=A0A9D1UFA9_9FIRM|nr:hypothetical protein [Candidatus Eubacterium faecipullorum]